MKPHPEYKRWMDKRKAANKQVIHLLDSFYCRKYNRRLSKWSRAQYRAKSMLIRLEERINSKYALFSFCDNRFQISFLVDGSLINFWTSDLFKNGNSQNAGFDILPLRFWHHFHCYTTQIVSDNKRFCFGCGIFSFFFDFPSISEYE